MPNSPSLMMTQEDFQKLSALVENVDTDVAALLEQELDRAQIVMKEELPNDVVTMNSEVKFMDLDTNKELVVVLVYPQDANIEKNRISILAPVGAALIGLRVGQTIDWPLPTGKEKHLKVTSVIAQFESLDDEHSQKEKQAHLG